MLVNPVTLENVLCFWTLYKLARCVFKKISILPSIGFLHCLYSSGSWEDRNYCSYQRIDGHWNSHSHCWFLAHTSVWPCACSQFTRITDISLKARPRVKKLLVTYYFFFLICAIKWLIMCFIRVIIIATWSRFSIINQLICGFLFCKDKRHFSFSVSTDCMTFAFKVCSPSSVCAVFPVLGAAAHQNVAPTCRSTCSQDLICP